MSIQEDFEAYNWPNSEKDQLSAPLGGRMTHERRISRLSSAYTSAVVELRGERVASIMLRTVSREAA